MGDRATRADRLAALHHRAEPARLQNPPADDHQQDGRYHADEEHRRPGPRPALDAIRWALPSQLEKQPFAPDEWSTGLQAWIFPIKLANAAEAGGEQRAWVVRLSSARHSLRRLVGVGLDAPHPSRAGRVTNR